MKQIVFLLALCIHVFSENLSVTFVNPGGVDDPFFSRLCGVMEEAADDLDISLEILYSGRDYLRGLEVGNTIFNRDKRPDYLILINENGMAERLVQEADSLGIKVLLFNEGFSDKYLLSVGNPVDVFENCIVDLLPNDSLAGYLLAKELIKAKKEESENGAISLLGITGSPRTTSSEERTKGLKQAVFEEERVTLLQTAPAYWGLEKAEAVTRLAYQRYPEIDIIWSASDQMAEGALKVIEETKKQTIVGGIDWASFAFDRVESKKFSVTVGGHFFDGAWILVLLHDYHTNGGLSQKHYLSKSFSAVTSNNVKDVQKLLKKDDWSHIDFSEYSHSDSADTNYDFSLGEILKADNEEK